MINKMSLEIAKYFCRGTVGVNIAPAENNQHKEL
jgi:hypothetical protein